MTSTKNKSVLISKWLEETEGLSKILDRIAFGVAIIDNEGRVAFWNRAAESFCGYKREEIVGTKKAWKLLFKNKADREELARLFKKYLSNEFETNALGESWLTAKNGYQFKLRWQAGRILNKKGEPHGLMIIGSDISAHIKTQEVLKDAAIRYQTLFECLSDAILIIDKESGVIVETNENAVKLLELPNKRIIGRRLDDFFQPGKQKEYGFLYSELLKQNKNVAKEFELVNAEGTIVPVEFRVSTVKLNERESFQFVLRDISERKRAEEEIEKSHREYQRLVEEVNSIILRMSSDGGVIYLNKYGQKFFNYTQEELFGKHIVGTIVPFEETDTKRNLKQLMGEVCKAPDKFISHINENMTKGGKRVWVSWTNRPVYNEKGELIEIFCVGNDITEKRQAEREREFLERQLHQAQKLESIGKLAGGIAHDFNNVLTAIIGFASLLDRELKNEPELKKSASNILTAATRGRELAISLLGFARQEELKLSNVNVNTAIGEVLEILSRVLNKNITVKTHLTKDVFNIHCDKNQLANAIMNICINSNDAMNDKGTLTIKTSNVFLDKKFTHLHLDAKTGPHVMIKISDTGCGMSKETLERAFEPFYTTKPSGKGSGLGLSRVYGAVKNMGGTILLESEINKGTTVTIYLPSATEEIEEEVTNLDTELHLIKKDHCILIVDDEEIVLEATGKMLELLGYKVLTAKNWRAGIKLLTKHKRKVSVVILDVIMPGVNINDVVAFCRETKPEVLILLTSGYVFTGEEIPLTGAGADGYLQKPFDMEKLALTLRKLFELKRDSKNEGK